MRTMLCQAEHALLIALARGCHFRLRFQRFGNGPSNFSQDFRSLFGDSNRVFSVSAGATIEGNHRPTIGQHFGLMCTEVNHRLDSKNIARPDLWSLSGFAIVRNLRIFVHATPNTMTNVLPHDCIAMTLCQTLDGPADIYEMQSRPALFDRSTQAFLGDADQVC